MARPTVKLLVCALAIAGCSKKAARDEATPSAPPGELAASVYGTPRENASIDRIAISGNGKLVVASGRAAITKLDLASKQLTTSPATEGLQDLAISADGTSTAVVEANKLTIDGTPIQLLAEREPQRAAFLPDGSLVVLASAPSPSGYSDVVHVIKLDGKHAVVSDRATFYTEDARRCELTVGTRGDIVIVHGCHAAHAIRIRDGAELAEWNPSRTSETAGVAEIAPGHFALAMIIGEDDRQLELWVPGRSRDLGPKDLAPCALASSGRLLACASTDNQLVFLDVATLATRARARLPEWPEALRFTPDGSQLVAGLRDGRLAVLDTAPVHASCPALEVPPAVLAIDAAAPAVKDAPRTEIKPAHAVDLNDIAIELALDSAGKQLAVMLAMRDIVVVDSAGKSEPRRIAGWNAQISHPGTAWSPDGKSLAMAESDETERLRVVSTTDEHAEPRDVQTDLKERHASWSSTGLIATGGPKYGLVQIWDAKTLAKLRVLDPPGDQWLSGLAFAPDGRLLSWGDWAPTIVWNAATATIERELAGHAGSILTASWSRDGRWLATAGRDHAVIVWNGSTLAPAVALRGMDPSGLAFSPDGSMLAITEREEILIWSIPDGKPLRRLAYERLHADLIAWPTATQLVVPTGNGLAWLNVPAN